MMNIFKKIILVSMIISTLILSSIAYAKSINGIDMWLVTVDSGKDHTVNIKMNPGKTNFSIYTEDKEKITCQFKIGDTVAKEDKNTSNCIISYESKEEYTISILVINNNPKAVYYRIFSQDQK